MHASYKGDCSAHYQTFFFFGASSIPESIIIQPGFFTPSTSGAFFKLWPFSKHYMEQCLPVNDLISVNVTDIPSIAFKMVHYTQGKGGVNYTQFLSISLCQQEFGQRVLLDLPICVLHTHMLWRDRCPLFCFYHHCFSIHQSKSIEVAHCKVQTEWLQLQHKLCFSS